MNKEISKLKPEAVWKNFYELTKIPRPSKHEDKIREFMVNWAKERNLEVVVDIEGHQDDARINVALEQIKTRTAFLKVLGSYPKTEM